MNFTANDWLRSLGTYNKNFAFHLIIIALRAVSFDISRVVKNTGVSTRVRRLRILQLLLIVGNNLFRIWLYSCYYGLLWCVTNVRSTHELTSSKLLEFLDRNERKASQNTYLVNCDSLCLKDAKVYRYFKFV